MVDLRGDVAPVVNQDMEIDQRYRRPACRVMQQGIKRNAFGSQQLHCATFQPWTLQEHAQSVQDTSPYAGSTLY
ncbi:MAG TPA: hypothetical protein VF513_02915 [Stenotrophomonas sp.]